MEKQPTHEIFCKKTKKSLKNFRSSKQKLSGTKRPL